MIIIQKCNNNEDERRIVINLIENMRLILTALFLGFYTISAPAQSCIEYSRLDYVHWIDADNDCQSTRNEVLIEESIVPVLFKTGHKCKVISGKWEDPYTGIIFNDPNKLDIDHVIPLKEAHDSGAWAWSSDKKKRFANYLEDRNHLVAVYSSANRRKSAKDPAEWLPKNKEFLKEYARIWVKIKVEWGLTADSKELIVLRRILAGEDISFPVEDAEYICSGNPFSAPASISGTIVKKSRSGICHDSSSRYYKKTKSYKAFETLQKCIDSGGRLPK